MSKNLTESQIMREQPPASGERVLWDPATRGFGVRLRGSKKAFVLFYRTPAGRRIQLLVIGLVLAGAIGNLYDNTFMPDRGVRDFLLFFYRGEGDVEHRFPAFNVADSCITVGAIGLAIMLWREPAKPVKPVSSGRDAGSRS